MQAAWVTKLLVVELCVLMRRTKVRKRFEARLSCAGAATILEWWPLIRNNRAGEVDVVEWSCRYVWEGG